MDLINGNEIAQEIIEELKIEVSAIKNGYYFFTILNSSGEFVVKQFTKY